LAKILPILLALIGLAAGIGGGLVMRPAPAEIETEDGSTDELDPHSTAAVSGGEIDKESASGKEPDYVKLNNQFVIPVVADSRVTALVVISLSLEITSGGPELVFKREPKLRDSFLQVLFDHANSGGFEGNFTTGRKMDLLRTALRESAVKILGPAVTSVLIADIVRQDM